MDNSMIDDESIENLKRDMENMRIEIQGYRHFIFLHCTKCSYLELNDCALCFLEDIKGV